MVMSMRKFGLFATLALLAMVCAAAPAAGQEMSERAARKACMSGDYQKGVDILSDLFINTRDAAHIYNQGRCYEQNGRCEEAVNRFREYLRTAKNPTVEEKLDTEKHIRDCQGLLSQPKAPNQVGAEAPPANVAASPSAPVESTAPAMPAGADVTAPAPQPVASSGSTWWIWAGVGAVVVAGTVTAILLATRSGGTDIPGSTLGSRTVSP
jgi:hypothetical protein